MPNNLTDKEIKKALECHKARELETCSKCPLLNIEGCAYELSQLALDLINRQDFKIHQLEKQVSEIQNANLIDFKGTIGNYKTENENLKAEVEKIKDDYMKLLETSSTRADIISKQSVENERLKNHIQEGIDLAKQIPEMLALAKAEAYKEFFEFIHNELCDISDLQFKEHNITFCVNFQIAIDKVREIYSKMVGDSNETL